MAPDGTWFDTMGHPLSRQLHSWLRLIRVHLRIQGGEYVQRITALLRGEPAPEEFHPIPPGHPLSDPHIPELWWAPLPPFGRYAARARDLSS